MKLRLLAATMAALTLTAGLASAQDTTSDKGKLSYALGFKMGDDLAGLTENGEQVDINTVVKALQDAYAKKQPTVPVDQLRTALQNLQQRQYTKAKAAFDKASADNQVKSNAFLAQNKAKPGVQTLADGVQYRVIEPGSGAKPTQASTVSIQYKGSIPNGPTFVDTFTPKQGQPAGPVSIKLSQVPLSGLREALLMMPTGARWEVTLPPAAAYGNTPESPVGPNQAVVFEVKLAGVQ